VNERFPHFDRTASLIFEIRAICSFVLSDHGRVNGGRAGAHDREIVRCLQASESNVNLAKPSSQTEEKKGEAQPILHRPQKRTSIKKNREQAIQISKIGKPSWQNGGISDSHRLFTCGIISDRVAFKRYLCLTRPYSSGMVPQLRTSEN